ncbi:unnamed protein product [Pleuronectes platessa]|uniref:Interferon gamma n=1 Tax=Pleuronectes platessa TaxID=8262 RepID=A0A9N7TZM4_PLEPL|nr:unnamed protein product [Pleuronectes platessa]
MTQLFVVKFPAAVTMTLPVMKVPPAVTRLSANLPSDMSPCSGSMCLLVLLGAVMALGNPIQHQKSMENLLGLEVWEVGSKPLFSSVIRSINTSCQRKEDIKLMNATLDVYMRIFSSILQHSHQGQASSSKLLDPLSNSNRSLVRSVLKKQQQKMEELRGNLRLVQHDNEDMIRQLSTIKVDDPLAQRKALAEFGLVYQAAASVAH